MKRVAIITARGGSKRIPRKNIRLFHGLPIIAYPIQIALQSKLFDEVMVSTDDKEIADIALKFGATVPFMRSPENSNDHAGTLDVLKEVVTSYQKINKNFDELCCIYPISPLIDIDVLVEASRKLQDESIDFVIPVARYSTPIQRALKVEDERLTMADPKNLNVRSQDLEPRFYDVGQFYFAKTKSLMSTTSLFTERTASIEMDEFKVQDVDNEVDWKILEFKYAFLKSQT